MIKKSQDLFQESGSQSFSQIPKPSTQISTPKRSGYVTRSQCAQENRKRFSRFCPLPKTSSCLIKVKRPHIPSPPSFHEDPLMKLYGISSSIGIVQKRRPSSKHDQEVSCRSQGQVERKSWSCLPKQYNNGCLWKSTLSQSSFKKEASSTTLNESKELHKTPEEIQHYNVSCENEVKNKLLEDMKSNKWNKFSKISKLSFMVLISLLGALTIASIGQHYFKLGSPIVAFQSTEMVASDTMTPTGLNVLLENYMQKMTEELRIIKEEISSAKEVVCVSNAVDTNRKRDILEELFTEEPDLACAGNLGSVLATPDTTTLSTHTYFTLMGLFSWQTYLPYRPPDTVIKGLIQEVGDCWAFSGRIGRLVLALHRPCLVTGVSLSHIPPTVTPSGNIASAPKQFIVMAHRSEDDFENGVQLGSFEYNNKGPWRQRFQIDSQVMKEQFRIIEFQFVNNQGNTEYTCVYRVHVHGAMNS